MSGLTPGTQFNEEFDEYSPDYSGDSNPSWGAQPGLLGYCPGDQSRPNWLRAQKWACPSASAMACEPPPPGTEESWPMGTETISPSPSAISSHNPEDAWSGYSFARPADHNQSAHFNFHPEFFDNQSESYIEQSASYINQSGPFENGSNPFFDQATVFDYQPEPLSDQQAAAWCMIDHNTMKGYDRPEIKPSRSGHVRHVYYPVSTTSPVKLAPSPTITVSSPSMPRSKDSSSSSGLVASSKGGSVCSTSVESVTPVVRSTSVNGITPVVTSTSMKNLPLAVCSASVESVTSVKKVAQVISSTSVKNATPIVCSTPVTNLTPAVCSASVKSSTPMVCSTSTSVVRAASGICSAPSVPTTTHSTSPLAADLPVSSCQTPCCSAAGDGPAPIVCCLRCIAKNYGKLQGWTPSHKAREESIVLGTKASEISKLGLSMGSATSASNKASTVTASLQDKLAVSLIPLPSVKSAGKESLPLVSLAPSAKHLLSTFSKGEPNIQTGHTYLNAKSDNKLVEQAKLKTDFKAGSGFGVSFSSKLGPSFNASLNAKPSLGSKACLSSEVCRDFKASSNFKPNHNFKASLNSKVCVHTKESLSSKANPDFNANFISKPSTNFKASTNSKATPDLRVISNSKPDSNFKCNLNSKASLISKTSIDSKFDSNSTIRVDSKTSLPSKAGLHSKTSLYSEVSPDSTFKEDSVVIIDAEESGDNKNNNARITKHKDVYGATMFVTVASDEDTQLDDSSSAGTTNINANQQAKFTNKKQHQGSLKTTKQALVQKERYLVNELLEREPEQSPTTMFKLLIWETYYKYFALRPLTEMSHFLMVQLYRILTHQISPSAFIMCKLCKLKEQFSLNDYLNHIQSMKHAQYLTRLIDKKTEYGYQALKKAAGKRSWFCDICPDADWTNNTKCYGISQHCDTSIEHQRRVKCIKQFIADAKALQDGCQASKVQRSNAPIPVRVKVAEKKFEMMLRFQVEAKLLSTSATHFFLCTMDACKHFKYDSDLDGYIRHSETLGHMMNLYAKLETFGSKNLFWEFIRFASYHKKSKKHFCGICPVRRPTDHFEPGSYEHHISSEEHSRNVRVIRQLYDRSTHGCLYTCADDCKVDHELQARTSMTDNSKSPLDPKVSKSSKSDHTDSSDVIAQIKAAAQRRLSMNTLQGIHQSVKSVVSYNDSTNTVTQSTSKTTSQFSTVKLSSQEPESKSITQPVDNTKVAPVEDTTKSILPSSLGSSIMATTHSEKKGPALLAQTCQKKNEKKVKDLVTTMEIDEAIKSSKSSVKDKILSPKNSDRKTTRSSAERLSEKSSRRSAYDKPYRSYKHDSSTSFKHRSYKSSAQSHRSYSRYDSSSRRSNSRSRKRSYKSRSRSSSSERSSRSSKVKKSRSKESYKRHRYSSASKSLDSFDSSYERTSRKKPRSSDKTSSRYTNRSSRSTKRRSRRSRSESSSSSSDRAQHSSRSSRSNKVHGHKSRSFVSSSDSSSSDSSCSSSSVLLRHKRCSSSSSRSLSLSPRGPRRGKRSRSLSKSSSLKSKRMDTHRQLRYISPPPFPLGNSSIYCIKPDFEKLNVRSLSPVSADVVSRTVENAWKFYHSRYYSQPKLSTDIVFDAQGLFLKSYSGFFTQAPNFENCYNTLYKPEDLKSALRMRLDRLSPGPAKEHKMVQITRESPEYQNNMVTSSQPALKPDASSRHSTNTPNTAESMKTLIKTGAVPGLSLTDDSETCAYNMSSISAASADSANDGIRNAIESLRQSYSTQEDMCKHGDLDSLTPAERKHSESSIPFLNDGTLDEVRKLPNTPEKKKVPCSNMELPWHYKQHSLPHSPESVCEADNSKDDEHAANAVSGNVSPIPHTKDHSNVIGKQKEEKENSTDKTALKSVGGVVMSTFIAEVVKGIIRLSTLQSDTELSPQEMLQEMEREQEMMHSRMITPAGHYMINMAKSILSPKSGQSMQLEFDKADSQAIELIKTLDTRVVELIASTPFLSE